MADQLLGGLLGLLIGSILALFVWMPISMRQLDGRSYKESMKVLFGKH